MLQSIESFTAIATIAGRARKIRFDELSGLTIEGLTTREASVVAKALSNMQLDDMQALLTADQKKVDRTPPPLEDSRNPNNHARWSPKADPRREITPDPDPNLKASVTGESRQAVTYAEKAREAQQEIPGLDEVVEEVVVEVIAEAQANSPQEIEIVQPLELEVKRRLLPPPTVQELADKRRGVLVELPVAGQEYKGVKIVRVKDHSDGRLLILADGFRVKLNSDGKEVTRMQGEPPPELQEGDALPLNKIENRAEALKVAEPVASPPPQPEHPNEEASEEDEGPVVFSLRQSIKVKVPSAIMETRVTRELIEFLMAEGYTSEAQLVEQAIKLKDLGALALAASKDADAVHRRIRSSLAVMGKL